MNPRLEEEAAIRAALTRLPGRAAVTHIARRPYAYQTSHRLDELTVVLEDGTCHVVLLKDLSRHGMQPAVASVKPAFLADPRREIGVYESLLAAVGGDAAACYGSLIDPEAERYWLLLERVPGLELYQIGEIETWQRVAARLARIHDRLGSLAGAIVDRVPLLRCDAGYYRRWLDRALRFTAPGDTPRLSALQNLAAQFERVWSAAASSDIGILHGEFYASNVLVDVAADRITPVDWEMAARGPALLDLAALVTGWQDQARREIMRAYFDGGTQPLGWDQFQQCVNACEVLIITQWLGWSRNWIPPREHRRDWMAALITRMGEI